jgi:alpha-D-ribose 1-methylphosphonate 5-triphosphate synthase subunit PhnH
MIRYGRIAVDVRELEIKGVDRSEWVAQLAGSAGGCDQLPEERLTVLVLVEPLALGRGRERGGHGAVEEEDLAVVGVDEVVEAGRDRPRPEAVAEERVGTGIFAGVGRLGG